MPAGAEKYCEYPANFIRIVNQFLLGIDRRLDGSIVLAPNVTDEFWDRGFGHVVTRPGSLLTFRLKRDDIEFTYCGPTALNLGLRLPRPGNPTETWQCVGAADLQIRQEAGLLWITLPPAPTHSPRSFQLSTNES